MTHRNKSLLVMLCTLVPLTAACASSRPRPIDASRAAIHLAGVDMAGFELSVRDQCEGAIRSALRRHGFVPGPGGPRVDIHVAFFDREQEILTPRLQSTADLTATVHGGGSPREISASGTGSDAHGTGAPMSAVGRSYYAACEAGAERLAVALVEDRHGVHW